MPPKLTSSDDPAPEIGGGRGVEVGLAHLLVGDEVGEEGRAALGAELHRAGGEPAHARLDVLDQRLAALAERARGRRGVVEVEVDLRGRGDGELGEVVHHRRAVLGVLHQPLDAVQQVVLEGRLGVGAQPPQPAGDLDLHLLRLALRAEGADALDLGGPDHVLLLELAADEGAHVAPLGHLLVVGRAALGERDQRQRAVAALDHHGARAHAAVAEEAGARERRRLEGDVLQSPGELDDREGVALEDVHAGHVRRLLSGPGCPRPRARHGRR